MSVPITLLVATREHLPDYIAALEGGWSPSSARPAQRKDDLEKIAADADDFLATFEDRDPIGRVVTLPDGSTSPRLPGFVRWIWDGELCGSIGLRWQTGTNTLPAHVLGHIGYGIIEHKRRRGYATEALRLMLPEAKREGLHYVEITTDPANIASQRVIEANGGRLIERFVLDPRYGEGECLRYRIDL